MDSISSSIAETIKKRAASATLGTYLFFWALYHWQGIVTLLFDDEARIYEKFGYLKNEYLNKYFFGCHFNDWTFYASWILPLALTYAFIWWVPRLILVKAYQKEQWYKVEKRRIRIEEERKLQIEAKDLAEQEVRTIDAEIKTSEKKKEAEKKDPKILWEREYEHIDQQEMEYLKNTLRCIYEFKGEVLVDNEYSNGPPDFELDPNALRFADSNELVNIVNNGQRIELTAKGKYFAGQYEGKI